MGGGRGGGGGLLCPFDLEVLFGERVKLVRLSGDENLSYCMWQVSHK